MVLTEQSKCAFFCLVRQRIQSGYNLSCRTYNLAYLASHHLFKNIFEQLFSEEYHGHNVYLYFIYVFIFLPVMFWFCSALPIFLKSHFNTYSDQNFLGIKGALSQLLTWLSFRS